jgi:FtsP/CotA-like multicopper oxidase with cupredoxin domain
MGVQQSNGTQGLTANVNQPFRVQLENKLSVPTAIHWHGLHPPNNQDGVPGVTQPVIRPDSSVLYDFPLKPAGTHWMHSHQGLQEALLAAPLIVHDVNDRARDEQEIVVFLGDFSFMPPKEVYAKLRAPKKMPMAAMKTGMGKPDANDWNYDAYLANYRTLNDPAVVHVEKGGKQRLRITNGSYQRPGSERCPERHGLSHSQSERHRSLRCKQPRVVVRALPCALASGCRDGNFGAV